MDIKAVVIVLMCKVQYISNILDESIDTCSTMKSLMHIHNLEDCSISICTEVPDIIQYLPNFLDTCETSLFASDSKFSECMSYCIQQDACLALGYTSTGDCHLCITGINVNVSIDETLDFIALESFVLFGQISKYFFIFFF